jgi:hypothetical protein
MKIIDLGNVEYIIGALVECDGPAIDIVVINDANFMVLNVGISLNIINYLIEPMGLLLNGLVVINGGI